MSLSLLNGRTYLFSGVLTRRFSQEQRRAFRRQEVQAVLVELGLSAELAEIHVPLWANLPPEFSNWVVVGDNGGETSISADLVRKYGLRPVDRICGRAREGRVLELTAWPSHEVPFFGNGAPEIDFPSEPFRLATGEAGAGEITRRVIELVAPIGKGTRALIVSPPKAGKTVMLKQIGYGIIQNHPEVELWVLLVDERPEEARAVRVPDPVRPDLLPALDGPNVRVFDSTFDKDDPSECVELAESVFERAKRSVIEEKKDVVILLDSLTRLARAYNAVLEKGWSGGFDQGGVIRPAKIFAGKLYGLARALPGYGSLTIIATAYTENNSRFDEAIKEEFTGRGNCDVLLSRDMARHGVYPAISIMRSETRNAYRFHPKEEKQLELLRTQLIETGSDERAMKMLLGLFASTESNKQLLRRLDGNEAVHTAFQEFVNASAALRNMPGGVPARLKAFEVAFRTMGLDTLKALQVLSDALDPKEKSQLVDHLTKGGATPQKDRTGATSPEAVPAPVPTTSPKKRSKKGRSPEEELEGLKISPELTALPG